MLIWRLAHKTKQPENHKIFQLFIIPHEICNQKTIHSSLDDSHRPGILVPAPLDTEPQLLYIQSQKDALHMREQRTHFSPPNSKTAGKTQDFPAVHWSPIELSTTFPSPDDLRRPGILMPATHSLWDPTIFQMPSVEKRLHAWNIAARQRSDALHHPGILMPATPNTGAPVTLYSEIKR